MGAPKQKWTAEEEAALKAGVIKHGAGKWRTILKDPEFSSVLYLRSNVDLKDKWRNMSVMANGWGSRDKARLAVKRTPAVPKQEDNALGQSSFIPSDEELEDVKPHAASSSATLQIPTAPKRSIERLDNLIIEAITSLKEPGGSNKTTIAEYIEDKYWAPSDFKRILSAKLKYLTTCGKLIKVKRKYRIAPILPYPERRTNPTLLHSDIPVSPRVEINDIVIPTMEEIELELAKMRTMTPQEAAAAAAQAVAEAEAAIVAAEQALREADEAEAEAEAAQAYAEAAMKTMQERKAGKMGHRA